MASKAPPIPPAQRSSPGDKPPVVRQKLNTLRATLEEMRRLATVGPVQAEAQLSPDNPYQ